MQNNIEKFNAFYKMIKSEINSYLKEYNESLVQDKTGYLKENLEL